ncbi:hypothetical protein [Vibrio cholerae]|uniref:hypothetical protein n=1 Tax=Vibrio cholerae TaxID=666 RepID=UPI00115AB987|nr:hypothetical protein [Vibrio cholerae]EGQ9837263.1 hypothetical protein [Vibrio cholerae]EJL6471105.1 hypothetical protein [Vibrio cholerae]EJL6717683.1 hypothetical protein [Vibrio cholerae]EKF9635658.1 hypothetical protein [Vibrio cholerae]MBO1368105.1 hypothetical protein [Vibrio cholerae]
MIPLPSNYSDFDPNFSTSWTKLEYPVKTTPRHYLDFALKDFEECKKVKSDRALVNALSNAKRSLHLQVETIAKGFGFANLERGYPNFHCYLNYCEKCGVVTPRILKKLNSVRNAVEHEYYIPTESETEDFIDVVELFLAATDKFIFQFPTYLEWLPGNIDDCVQFDIRSIELEPNTGCLMLVPSPNNPDDELHLDPSSNEFFIWLKQLSDAVHNKN